MSLVIESAPAPQGRRLRFLRTFPDLNDYTRALQRHWAAGAGMKRENTELVRDIACLTRQPSWDVPVKVLFRWYEENDQRDIDNVAFAKKFILDGLVEAGVLADDGQGDVVAVRDELYVDPDRPRVEIDITPADTEEWEQKGEWE